MSAQSRSREEESAELQDLQVRVVRLSELGARAPVAAQPAPLATPAPPRRPQVKPPPAHAQRTTARPAIPGPAPKPELKPPPAHARRTAAPATAAAAQAAPRRRLITPARVFFVAATVLLYLGWHIPTEHYITPKRGVGYALGIVGGSLMLILLVYSLRKRYTWLRWLGSTPSWFRFHMVLGILGPLCILYHANFSTGATNSNVALFAMLTVAGSGLIGRYIYAHIHHGLYGRKLELGDLRAGADNLRSLSSRMGFLPELVARIETAERRVLSAGPQVALLGFTKPPVVGAAAMWARWRLHRYVSRALRRGARKSAVLAAERPRLRATAYTYIDRRIAATRRVAAFQGYERLFSLWHALHIPLIFMMIIAAVIHVIAVHVY